MIFQSLTFQAREAWLDVQSVLSCSSCVWPYGPMHCGPPGSSVPGILQARTLEGVAIVFSRESSGPKDRTRVSWVTCTGMRVPSHKRHLGCHSSRGYKELDVTLQLNSGNIFLSGEHTRAAVQISSCTSLCTCAGFPHSSAGKESACNSGDPGSIPGRGRSTGEGIGYPTPVFLGFPCGSAGKESTCNSGDLGMIPGLGRSP